MSGTILYAENYELYEGSCMQASIDCNVSYFWGNVTDCSNIFLLWFSPTDGFHLGALNQNKYFLSFIVFSESFIMEIEEENKAHKFFVVVVVG